MTKAKALAERERLQEKSATLGRSKAEAGREAKAIEADAQDLSKQRRVLLAEQVNGNEDARGKVEAIDAEILSKQREAEQHSELVQVATRELKAVKRELQRLYATAPEAFMDEAMAATDAAVDARNRALTALSEAEQADTAARRAWSPLIDAARTVATDGQTRFGGRAGRNLGKMPRIPEIWSSSTSALGIRSLRDAPPPAPEHVRKPRTRQAADVVPGPIRRVLGIPEPPPRPKVKPRQEESVF